MTKREQALLVLNAVPEGAVIRSHQGGPPYLNRFAELTNTNHAVMLANWLAGGIMTACNGFVNWYAQQLGIRGISNWFNLRNTLFGMGLGHAWVQASSGAKPQPGDILKHRITHVDVALGVTNGILRRVAAGQGDGTALSTHPRPRAPELRAQEYDVLRRVTGGAAYNPQNLEGWLDLEKYFAPKPHNEPVPAWLEGWWRVTWRGTTYYYYFDAAWQASWVSTPPSGGAPPLFARDVADVNWYEVMLEVRWRNSGSVERLSPRYGLNSTTLKGTWNNTEPIEGVKL